MVSVKIEYRHEDSVRIVYDADSLDQANARLFDPHYWQARAALAGQAAGRGTIWFVRQGDTQFALRHYRRGGLVAKLFVDRYLWTGLERTRAWREWRLLADLHRRGLPVPAPVAARVVRDGLYYRADLITQRIPAAEPLSRRLQSSALSAVDWRRLGAQLRSFHDVGVDHADLNAHNILLDPRNQFWLIDFDRARLRRAGRWTQGNLDRLHRSLTKLRGLSARFDWTQGDWASLQEGYAWGESTSTDRLPADSDAENTAVRGPSVLQALGSSRLGCVMTSAVIALAGDVF